MSSTTRATHSSVCRHPPAAWTTLVVPGSSEVPRRSSIPRLIETARPTTSENRGVCAPSQVPSASPASTNHGPLTPALTSKGYRHGEVSLSDSQSSHGVLNKEVRSSPAQEQPIDHGTSSLPSGAEFKAANEPRPHAFSESHGRGNAPLSAHPSQHRQSVGSWSVSSSERRANSPASVARLYPPSTSSGSECKSADATYSDKDRRGNIHPVPTAQREVARSDVSFARAFPSKIQSPDSMSRPDPNSPDIVKPSTAGAAGRDTRGLVIPGVPCCQSSPPCGPSKRRSSCEGPEAHQNLEAGCMDAVQAPERARKRYKRVKHRGPSRDGLLREGGHRRHVASTRRGVLNATTLHVMFKWCGADGRGRRRQANDELSRLCCTGEFPC